MDHMESGKNDPDATPAWSEPSTTLSCNGFDSNERFRKVRPYASGGLGEVFVAQDLEFGREVALNEMRAEFASDPNGRARFLHEAEMTGLLEHPGIVPTYGMGVRVDGRPFTP